MHRQDFLHPGEAAAVGADPSATAATRSAVAAGFGSPSHDTTVRRIDLNDALIQHPQATFVMRAEGTGMRDAGIDGGDVLVVDRAVAPGHGHIVIAVLDGELVCRRLHRPAPGAEVVLQAANPEVADHRVPEGDALDVWGVVTYVIKSLAHAPGR
jgi:DNA polymerase V